MAVIKQKHIAGKSKNNGVAEQEKGVNVVQFQDGIAQVPQRPMAQGWARTSSRFLSASAVAKLGPRDGTSSSEKERDEMKERTVATAGVWTTVPS
jgi:hypothetical protein